MTTSIRLHVVFPSLSVSTCSQDDAQRKRKSVRKTVDIPFLKSVDKQKSQQYQGVARSGKEMTDTISSQPRYDHFDTAAYRDQSVINQTIP